MADVCVIILGDVHDCDDADVCGGLLKGWYDRTHFGIMMIVMRSRSVRRERSLRRFRRCRVESKSMMRHR